MGEVKIFEYTIFLHDGFWAWLSGMLRNQFRKQHCKNTALPKHLNYWVLARPPLLLNSLLKLESKQ